METPSAIIYPYFRGSGYPALNIPKRITNECNITSGVRFLAYVRDGKLVIEQIKEDKNAILVGTGSTKS